MPNHRLAKRIVAAVSAGNTNPITEPSTPLPAPADPPTKAPMIAATTSTAALMTALHRSTLRMIGLLETGEGATAFS